MDKIFSYAKLKGKIVEKYGTRAKFAEALGISETWLSQKMSCKSEFSQDDMMRWGKLLDIEPEEYHLYFFA